VPMISVHRLREGDGVNFRLPQEIQMLHDRISRRAYDLYEARRAADGSPVNDWLRAEREVCWVPQVELQETDRAFHLMIRLSDVADERIEVNVLPEMIVLRSASENESGAQCGADLCQSEPKLLFGWIVFPSQIHAESAVIRLEDDLLRVSAAKLEQD
jgi:HSP20 family molecular chaperone IbpA